jgi:prohibitin 1
MSRLFSGFAGTIAKGALLIGTTGFLLEQSLYNVEAGHRAVIFDRFSGIKEKPVGEGTHFLIPAIQRANMMDVRIQPHSIHTITGTKDLQTVNLSLRVLYHPHVDTLPIIFKQLGIDYATRVLPSVGNEVLKAIVAQYNADQLLTLRDKVSREIREQLSERCKSFNIVLDDVSITNLNFSAEFAKAIEDKQVAEQDAERAKFVVAKAEQEKIAKIVKAEGEATAARMVSDALKKSGRGLIEIRRIDAALSVADTLAHSSGNVVYLPSSGGNLLLNIPTDR